MRTKTRIKLGPKLPKLETKGETIVDVNSASEPKEGDKGPGSASKSEDHLSGSLLSENNSQSSSSESKEAGQSPSSEEIEKELHANRIARGKAIVGKFRAERERDRQRI
jgi:hypothetical protein